MEVPLAFAPVSKVDDDPGAMPEARPLRLGSAAGNRRTALLLIDVINDFQFEGYENLLEPAKPAARRIAELKRRAREAGIPVIYVNDNFGRWQCDFAKQIERCLSDGCPGNEVVRLLRPGPDDYFVLKPKHSGFFCTSLDVLLADLGSGTLILAGFAGDNCVVHTAADAHMRDYGLIVPADCIASETPEGNRAALEHMRSHMHAEVSPSDRLELPRQPGA